MILFVGLGNPSPDSHDNRHNIGFKIIDAIRIPNYGGSIRICATLNKNISPNRNVKQLLDLEKKKGFFKTTKYKKFSKDVIKSKNNLLNILRKIKKRIFLSWFGK